MKDYAVKASGMGSYVKVGPDCNCKELSCPVIVSKLKLVVFEKSWPW